MKLLQNFMMSIVLLSLLALLLPYSVAMADRIVTFPDPNLESAIRKKINEPTGPIYQSDLDYMVSFLEAKGKGIIDLSGLEYCIYLGFLDLEGNQISDISPLSNLTDLDTIALGQNQISDISPLSNLNSLEYLYLEQNQISDISPLSNLTVLSCI